MPHLLIDDVPVELVRKSMRTLRLTVLPPDGRVRVSAPLRMPTATIHDFLRERRAWIHQHRARIQARPRPAQPTFTTGETHYYQGQSYTLRVHATDSRPRVKQLEAGYLDLYSGALSTAAEREAALKSWYRARLKEQVPVLLAQWQAVVGAQAAEWGIKQMKTRWGTCNTRAKRIWLNLELVKYPLPCLEYVVVHELVHLHERLHNARFWGFMDQFMPEWREHKATLSALVPGTQAC